MLNASFDVILSEAKNLSDGGLKGDRPFAEFTLSGDRFFASLRMTWSEGLSITGEGLRVTPSPLSD